jgi:cysteine desulfurase
LPVYENGIVRIEDVRSAIRPDTVLFSNAANNEPSNQFEIAALVREHRDVWSTNNLAPTDASRQLAAVQINVEELGCDLLSVGHKVYAPKESVRIRRGVRLARNVGGHQERERRWRKTSRHAAFDDSTTRVGRI